MKTLFENAWILTMDEELGEIRGGWLLTDGKRIAALGGGAFEGECDARIDARGGILLPGFVNLHCHASMVPFRTMGDDCRDRLRRFLFPLENEAMTRNLAYLGAKYAVAEMLLSGCTAFVDMYYFEDAVADACREAGMLGYLGETVISQPTCDSPQPDGGLDLTRRLFDACRGDEWVRPIVAPHGTTTCTEQTLRRCAELAREHQALLTLHVSEMDYEMQFFAERGQTPLEYLDSLGAVDERLLAAHCIHLTPGDIELLRARGASVAHCIGSNTKAGKGVAPVRALAEAGVTVGLGTDGPSSGNTLSPFDQMRLFADFHKTVNRDRSLFTAKEIVALATREGARALHADGEFGRLRPGLRADLTLVSLDAANMFPVYNPYSALVYSANASNVDTVMTAGVLRVRHGRLCQMELESLRAALAAEMKPFVKAAARYPEV